LKKREINHRFLKLFSVDVFVKASGLLLLPLYLNLMTQEEFGNYSYIFSIIGMWAFVFGMGQHATLNRFYHSNEYTRDLVIENIHLILMSSFVFFGVVFIFFQKSIVELFFKSVVSNMLFYCMIVLAMLIALNQIFMSFLYQAEKISIVQKKNITDFFVINTLALFLLFSFPYSKDKVRVFAMLISYALILSFFYRFFVSKKHLKFSNKSIIFYKRGLKNGFPMAVGSFSNFFIAFGDRFVIEKLLNKSFLGIFSFTMAIIGILMLVFSSFQNVWLPYHFKEKNLDISFRRVYKIIFIFFGVSLVAGVGFYILVYILANYFIEYSYIKSLDFLWVLVLASFFQIAGMITAGFYQIYEKSHICVPINILAGILNIYINYHFIENYGVLGAAISTLLISFMLFLLHFYLVHYYRRKGNYGEYFTKYQNQ
jgi:O-antigen/teichoic acid export membrane protein